MDENGGQLNRYKKSMIGLTGGIGSGKSRVLAQLCLETGFASVSADAIAAEVLGHPGSALRQLRELIGGRYFFSDGTLDRASFRKVLFADTFLREKVDHLLHPLIFLSLQEKVDTLMKVQGRSVIAEVPLLFEAGWQEEFSEIIVVYAPLKVCKKRLIERDMLSAVEAERAIATQMDIEEKVILADYVIDNSTTWSDTLMQIRKLSRNIFAKSA